jgi:hypothetical protein
MEIPLVIFLATVGSEDSVQSPHNFSERHLESTTHVLLEILRIPQYRRISFVE